jgi:hypothetical protein
MSILKKEVVNKSIKTSFKYILKPFKPAIDKLDTYYLQLMNYEETLKIQEQSKTKEELIIL